MIIQRFILVAVFLLIWQGFVWSLHIPTYIFPDVISVIAVFYRQFDVLFSNTWPTLLEIMVGFIVGVTAGITVAISMTAFDWMRTCFRPLLVMSQAIPIYALAPLFVLWFGYGLFVKIAMIAIMLCFPVASIFFDGLQGTKATWLELATVMNASRMRTLWHIRIPAALPSLASGLKLAAVLAPIGAIVSEWVGSSRGLGFLMLNANARLQIPLLFASVINLVVITVLFYYAVDKVFRWLVPKERFFS